MICYNLINNPVRLKVHFSVIFYAAFNQLWRVVPSFRLLIQAQHQRIKLLKYVPGIFNRVFSRDVTEQVNQIKFNLVGEANLVAFQ